MPSTLSLGAAFYGLISSYLYKEKNRFDRWIVRIPVLFLVLFSVLEVIHYTSFFSESIKLIRIFSTQYTLKFVYPVYNLILIVRTIYKLISIEKDNQQIHADENVVDLKWTKISLWIYVLFFAGMVASNLSILSAFTSELIFNSAILILVLYVGYFQIRKIVDYMQLISEKEIVIEKDSTNDNLEFQDKFKLIYTEIEQLIVENDMYLNYDISVSLIAKELKVNTKYISQAVNIGSGMNFNNYINAKRVRYSQGLLSEGIAQKLSIEGVANKSGFRSKSAFNTAFKRVSGMTPTAYLKVS